jgi:AbrB family looped-hinge helix DNA binding protein
VGDEIALTQLGKKGKTLCMSTATLSTKGQLVIPHRFRRALQLNPGDKVSFSLEGEKLVLQRDAPERARLVRGKFGRPVLVAPPHAPPMTPENVQAILEEFL